ncbi:MAG TPA: YbaK/EbsC family protein [Syntrophomonadaceae bacterium]|nr:YbaK/EbsC family protein [Syntrophomonadaceae bacterium]
MATERVRKFFTEKGLDLSIIEFDADTSTSQLAAEALGTEVSRIAKSMVFKTKEEDYIMILAAGDVRINSKAVRDLVGSRTSMAKAEEVMEVTGYYPGGVCPYALETPIPVYLDESLKDYDVIYTAAGTANTVLPISFAELKEITGASVCRVAK